MPPAAGDVIHAPPFGAVVRTNYRPTRPAPQPHNAGITPGHRHLSSASRAVRRGELRRALRGRDSDTAEAIAVLVGRISALEQRLAAHGGR